MARTTRKHDEVAEPVGPETLPAGDGPFELAPAGPDAVGPEILGPVARQGKAADADHSDAEDA